MIRYGMKPKGGTGPKLVRLLIFFNLNTIKHIASIMEAKAFRLRISG